MVVKKATRKPGDRGLFFGCRSYKYLAVIGSRRTTTIRVSDVRFFTDRREVQHGIGTMAWVLEGEDVVAITFCLKRTMNVMLQYR